MQPGPLNPASLPPGAQVGPWLVVDRRGSGAYGAVYLVEGVTPGASGEAALKLAQHPWDERFGREAELLSRIRHPCVPRLIDHGEWLSPSGLSHAYIAMELVFDHAWCISSQFSFPRVRVAGQRRSCCSRSFRRRVSSSRSA
jgi:serine/threonine protein kinase